MYQVMLTSGPTLHTCRKPYRLSDNCVVFNLICCTLLFVVHHVCIICWCKLLTSHVVVCEQYAIRLVGGTTVFEGRVELCIDETWNTVCADSAWTNIDANIACRQAGYAATGMHVL